MIFSLQMILIQLLYSALSDNDGKVYGILYNSEIIGLLAVDHSLVISDFFCNETNISSPIVEVGWALVKNEFRGIKIISLLNRRIEKDIKKLKKIEHLVTTVHPENISGLIAFFNMGYSGIRIFNHYNSIRMILTKSLTNNTVFNSNVEQLYSSIGDLDEQKKLFDSGYTCIEFDRTKEKLVFTKTN